MKKMKKLGLIGLLSITAGCAHQPDREAQGPVVTAAPAQQTALQESKKPIAAPLVADLPLVVHSIETEPASTKSAAVTPTPLIWDRIRRGMTMADRDNPGIAGDLAWFQSHQAYLDRTMERARPYMHFIVDEVQRRGMPTEIALLPVVESAFQPFAYSNGRAAGIWQFIPGTGKRFGLKQTWWYDGRRDIANSTRAALDYLQSLHDEFNGDWELALAAYNSGEGTVHRAIRENQRKGKPTDFWSLKLPKETEGYVPKLLAISALVANPSLHGVTLLDIPDEPLLTAVDTGSQIDLDLAAELAGISIDDMYRYNPAFNRWATDPDGPHALLVPIEVADQFKERIAQLPKSDRIQWVHHKVAKGEAIGTIARHYGTTTELIRSVNSLHTNSIRVGNTLVIPVARKELTRYSLSADQRVATAQETPREGRRVSYTVQAGDTLWSIASRHEVTLDEVCKWNGMAPRDPLAAGKRLVLWLPPEEPAILTAASADTTAFTRVSLGPRNFVHPQKEELQRRIAYKVRRGDSVTTIAKRFRISVNDLLKWNRLSTKSRLRRGQKLTLFVDVTRQSGT
jgi:membrane-bound lytic murein transglycosylase D